MNAICGDDGCGRNAMSIGNFFCVFDVDLGRWSREDWELFLTRIQKEGI